MKIRIIIFIILVLISISTKVYAGDDLRYLERKYNLERFKPSAEDFKIYPNFDTISNAEKFIKNIKKEFSRNDYNIKSSEFTLFPSSGLITFQQKTSPINKIVCDVSYLYKYDTKLKENIYTKITNVVSRKTGFIVFSTWEQKSYSVNVTNGGRLKTSLSVIIKGDHIAKIIIKGMGEVYREHGQYNFYKWGEPE